MRILERITAAAILLGLTASAAAALDPNAHISQYRHTAWRVQEGAFEAAPNVITQTADGYLWIGNGSGLVKYDGVRFVSWTPPPSTRANLGAIYSLRSSSDGTLWIG